jgi:hypothetical protein
MRYACSIDFASRKARLRFPIPLAPARGRLVLPHPLSSALAEANKTEDSILTLGVADQP